MMDSHCEILWVDNPGAGLGHHTIADYGATANNAENQSIIAEQILRYKMLGLWIKNSLNNSAKRKLRDFKSTYTFNTQDDGVKMFFVVVRMVQPYPRAV